MWGVVCSFQSSFRTDTSKRNLKSPLNYVWYTLTLEYCAAIKKKNDEAFCKLI